MSCIRHYQRGRIQGLDLIRRIRNEFAHELRVAFKDQKIIDLCSQTKGTFPGMPSDSRKRYSVAALALIFAILNRTHVGAPTRLIYIDPEREITERRNALSERLRKAMSGS